MCVVEAVNDPAHVGHIALRKKVQGVGQPVVDCHARENKQAWALSGKSLMCIRHYVVPFVFLSGLVEERLLEKSHRPHS